MNLLTKVTLLSSALLCFSTATIAQEDKTDSQEPLQRGQLAIPIDNSAVPENEGAPVKDAKLESQAIDALATHLSVDTSDIAMVSMTAREWPNSSLGCPKPGHQYLDVITPGYQAILKVGQKSYRVNMTEKYAVVCDSLSDFGPRENIPPPGAETE